VSAIKLVCSVAFMMWILEIPEAGMRATVLPLKPCEWNAAPTRTGLVIQYRTQHGHEITKSKQCEALPSASRP
jgi:hypothetical protein